MKRGYETRGGKMAKFHKGHRLFQVWLSDPEKKRLDTVMGEGNLGFSSWVRAMIARCEADRIESQGTIKKVIPDKFFGALRALGEDDGEVDAVTAPGGAGKLADLCVQKAEEIRRIADFNYSRDHLYDARQRLRRIAEEWDNLAAVLIEWEDELHVREVLVDRGDRRTRRHRVTGRARGT